MLLLLTTTFSSISGDLNPVGAIYELPLNANREKAYTCNGSAVTFLKRWITLKCVFKIIM